MHAAPSTRPPAAYPWRMPLGWWLKNRRYFLYMVRELTAVFAALWVVWFLIQLPQMAGSPEMRELWRTSTLRSPGWVLFSLVSLGFVLYHSWTWFNLAGAIICVKLGKRPIPGSLIISGMFIAWFLASLVIAFILVNPSIGAP